MKTEDRPLTVEDVMKCAEDLQRVPERSEEAQEVFDTLFNYFSRMILNSDFVKVVRCKDCKKHNDLKYPDCLWTDDDFYCADGERRDTNECK